MASPANDSYSCASGGVIAAGRHHQPAWLGAMPVGQWAAATGSAIGSSSALYDWGGSVPGMQSSVVDAWGGWAVDYPARKIYLQGGGHSDYGGNEIYCCDLNTLVWTRIVDPTSMAQATRFINGWVHSKWNSDGTPVSAHIYWTAHLVNGVILRTPFFADFGQTNAGTHAFAPNNEACLHGFNVATGQWDAPVSRALLPNYVSSDLTSGGIGYLCVSDGAYYYALLFNAVLSVTKLHRYDPAADTWTPIGSIDLGPYAGETANGTFVGAIYDSTRREMVQICENSYNFVRRINLDTGVKTHSLKTGIPFASTWDSSYTGGCYDSRRDLYYMYSGQSGKDKNVYVCDPANNYEISVMVGTGTPTPTTPGAGMNSRFKYFPGWDCVVMQPTFADPLQILRLS